MKKKSVLMYSIFLFALLLGYFYSPFHFHSLKHEEKSNTTEPLLTKIILGTDWFAQAEHGGFYQAIAEGIYKKYGLDVQIKMGGPQVNGMQMLLAGETTFFIPPSYIMLAAAQKKLPVVSVAALFQKDLEILMAHPNMGHDSFEQLRGKPIFISAPTAASIWGFLSGKYGYTEDQKKSYSNSLIPFLNDKNAIQEGLLTSEPFIVEKQGNFKPVTLLLSDYGYTAYGELITCTKEFEQSHSDIVKNFVMATKEGWKHYLKNPELGNALIKKDNPEMKDDVLDYAVHKLNEKEILTGGDAQDLGIGAMTDKRWNDFYSSLVKSKSIQANIDFRSIYTLKYVGNTHSNLK